MDVMAEVFVGEQVDVFDVTVMSCIIGGLPEACSRLLSAHDLSTIGCTY